jgi:hypothetical protein
MYALQPDSGACSIFHPGETDMAQDDSGNNVAIIAVIIIAVLVAGAAFLYLQDSGPASGPAVIERETIKEPTVIERDTTIITPPPEEAPPQEEGGKATIEHEDEEGNKTEIQVEE